MNRLLWFLFDMQARIRAIRTANREASLRDRLAFRLILLGATGAGMVLGLFISLWFHPGHRWVWVQP